MFERNVFLHSAIHVPNSLAMHFWTKYFERRHEVSFDELLAAMTNEALRKKPVVEEFPLSRDRVHFLHLLFVQDSVQSTVSLERFGRVCALLGPFDLPGFPTRVCALFKVLSFVLVLVNCSTFCAFSIVGFLARWPRRLLHLHFPTNAPAPGLCDSQTTQSTFRILQFRAAFPVKASSTTCTCATRPRPLNFRWRARTLT